MQEKLLNDEISTRLKEMFAAQLVNPVELVFFSNQEECATCDETAQVLNELTRLSDKISVKIYDIKENPEIAKSYNLQMSPGLVITTADPNGSIDYGIRFLGSPSGYEFASLIHAIELVSRGDSGLKPETRMALKGIVEPVELKVFVTPT
jgi:glutaredoxin-like protein